VLADRSVGRIVRVLLPGRPRSGMERLFFWSVAAALFLFPFSLVFVAGGWLPEGYGWTSTVSITLYALVMLGAEPRRGSARSAAVTAGTIGVTFFAVEWIGMNTGFPFGRYAYTDVLQPLVAGVPVAIAIAWYSTLMATERIGHWLAGDAPYTRIRVAVLAGLLTLALDVVLEPFASFVNGYWLWEGGRVPLQNYAAWFGLSVAGVWFLSGRTTSERPDPPTAGLPAALLVYCMQFALFSITIVMRGHGTYVAAGILIVVVSVLAAGGRIPLRLPWRAVRR